MGDGGGLQDPAGGGGLALLQVAELPHVGDPADGVAEDEHADYGQADLGVDHVPAGGRSVVPAVLQRQNTKQHQ